MNKMFLNRVFGSAVLVALVVALAGCLKFPLGDPETAKVDPSLVGAWFHREDDGAVAVWNVQEYDARTYLVTQFNAKPDNNGGWERSSMSISKAWLTKVKDKEFACLQVMSETTDKPYCAIKLERAGETLTVHGVNGDKIDKENPADAAAFAKYIEDHVDDPEIYIEAQKYEKVGDADRETVQAIMKAFF